MTDSQERPTGGPAITAGALLIMRLRSGRVLVVLGCVLAIVVTMAGETRRPEVDSGSPSGNTDA